MSIHKTRISSPPALTPNTGTGCWRGSTLRSRERTVEKNSLRRGAQPAAGRTRDSSLQRQLPELIMVIRFYCHPEEWNNSKAFPAGDPRGGLRKDFAVTRADDTSVRSHPQLFNGRLRSTTASCGTTASSRRAPPDVVVTAYPAWPAAPPVCRAPSPNTNQR